MLNCICTQVLHVNAHHTAHSPMPRGMSHPSSNCLRAQRFVVSVVLPCGGGLSRDYAERASAIPNLQYHRSHSIGTVLSPLVPYFVF
jgi:hypothetical protein